MNNQTRPIHLNQVSRYRISIQGRIENGWADWMDDLVIKVKKTDSNLAITMLTGTVSDQVALHGLLARIRDLGLPLISVEYLDIE